MSYTLQEIESQPEIWRKVIEKFIGERDACTKALARLQFSRIVTIGCGSTYYLSCSASQFLKLYTNYEIQAYPASEAWLMPDLFPVAGTLLLAISRSGTTTETLRAVERFRTDGGKAISVITCYPKSPLATLADVVISATEAQEKSVVQTRSFTSMYLLAAGLAFILGEQPKLLTEMQLLPDELESLLINYGDWPGIWADLDRFQKIFFLGNGPNYGLACEAMLKVKEMSLSWVEAFHTLEFRHGPMSLVDEETLVVGFVSDTMRQPEFDVLQDMQKLGASIVLCDDGQGGDISWKPEYHLHTRLKINQWLRGVSYLPLIHRLGYHRALAKNQNPDNPKNLNQVIEFAAQYHG